MWFDTYQRPMSLQNLLGNSSAQRPFLKTECCISQLWKHWSNLPCSTLEHFNFLLEKLGKRNNASSDISKITLCWEDLATGKHLCCNSRCFTNLCNTLCSSLQSVPAYRDSRCFSRHGRLAWRASFLTAPADVVQLHPKQIPRAASPTLPGQRCLSWSLPELHYGCAWVWPCTLLTQPHRSDALTWAGVMSAQLCALPVA